MFEPELLRMSQSSFRLKDLYIAYGHILRSAHAWMGDSLARFHGGVGGRHGCDWGGDSVDQFRALDHGVGPDQGRASANVTRGVGRRVRKI